jgi:hypothetical protein
LYPWGHSRIKRVPSPSKKPWLGSRESRPVHPVLSFLAMGKIIVLVVLALLLAPRLRKTFEKM